MIPIIPSNIIQHVVVFELGGPLVFFFGTCSSQSTCDCASKERDLGRIHCCRSGGGGFKLGDKSIYDDNF